MATGSLPEGAGTALVRAIGGLLTGVTVAAVLFMVLPSPFSLMANSGNTTEPDGTSDNMTAYYLSATSALLEAADKFQDEDLSRFYQKLIGSYALDDASSWLAPDDGSDDPEAVPDIEKIQRAALTLPLLEAGNQIRDPGIAEFYQDFLKKAGWTLPE